MIFTSRNLCHNYTHKCALKNMYKYIHYEMICNGLKNPKQPRQGNGYINYETSIQ